MLKITEYAERLLRDLDPLDWSESLKTMQREWIGRSEARRSTSTSKATPARSCACSRPARHPVRRVVHGAGAGHALVAQIASAAQRDAVEAYVKAAAAKSELSAPTWPRTKAACSGAYAHNPLFAEHDPKGRIPIWVADYVIVSYGTGAIMAVPAGDERDFEFAQKFGIPIPGIFAPTTGDAERDARIAAGQECCTDEAPYAAHCRTHDGKIVLAGKSLQDGKRAILDWLVAEGRGEAKVTYKIRDWLFSRQRYWGEPFPVLHTEDGVALVPDEQLPVLLPDMEDFKPGGQPESPLIRATDWVATIDAKGRPAQREINTMPGAAGSSWYFLRFCDPHNEREFCSKAASDYWLPVDLYVGGTEHAVGHLLYSRFWTKVLHDQGLVTCVEPFHKLYNQGMIQAFAYQDGRGAIVPKAETKEQGDDVVHATTGEKLTPIVTKMSKRYGNVVNPDDVVGEYGADTLRLYEMYMGPLADSKPWNPKDVPGVHRFLQRAWRLCVPEFAEKGQLHEWLQQDRDADPQLEKALHRTIHKVEGDIERMAFNTAIAAMMIFVNEATKAMDKLSRSQLLRFAQLLQPFAPHVAEELWQRLSGDGLLCRAAWPTVDPALLVDDEVEIAVQVLGKLRARVTVPTGAAKDVALAAAREAAAQWLDGKTVVKEIVVPDKLVNFVVK
ncbi:MAG: leucine--tRNA ligase [Planctomycetota bacterium]